MTGVRFSVSVPRAEPPRTYRVPVIDVSITMANDRHSSSEADCMLSQSIVRVIREREAQQAHWENEEKARAWMMTFVCKALRVSARSTAEQGQCYLNSCMRYFYS